MLAILAASREGPNESDVCSMLFVFQGGLVGHLAKLECKSGPLVDASAIPQLPLDRQGSWERGDIDYTGADRFSNIKAVLDKNLK